MTLNKLLINLDGEWPSPVPFALIWMLQALWHQTIERKKCRVPVVHNDITLDDLSLILMWMQEEEQLVAMKDIPPPLPYNNALSTRVENLSLEPCETV
jgi:hypothetical protein